MTVPYQWKKALINSSQVLIGVLVVKIAPYSSQLTMGVWPPDFTWPFLRHALFSALIITAAAEFRYFYKWLMSLNGGPTITPLIPPK